MTVAVYLAREIELRQPFGFGILRAVIVRIGLPFRLGKIDVVIEIELCGRIEIPDKVLRGLNDPPILAVYKPRVYVYTVLAHAERESARLGKVFVEIIPVKRFAFELGFERADARFRHVGAYRKSLFALRRSSVGGIVIERYQRTQIELGIKRDVRRYHVFGKIPLSVENDVAVAVFGYGIVGVILGQIPRLYLVARKLRFLKARIEIFLVVGLERSHYQTIGIDAEILVGTFRVGKIFRIIIKRYQIIVLDRLALTACGKR